jgi:arginine utilization protein RocB
MKKCISCGENKEISCYYVHAGMADGYLNKCKDCAKKEAKKNYQNNRDRYQKYEQKRFKNPERKAKLLIYQRRRRAKNKVKDWARQVTARAVKSGKIVKLPCQVCGDINSEAHHTDYTDPYNVQWLCFKHHREAHGQKTN